MIVLDTNVVSETFRPTPSAQVLSWLDANAPQTLYLTSITLAELRFGVAALPAGRRKQGLHDVVENVLVPRFRDRILPFDEPASLAFAHLQSSARTDGRALPTMDALIAAICRSRGFTLATRNTRDFLGAGIPLIDPWAED